MAGESILIVDDNPVNQKLARVVLQRQGYVVLTASDGNEALSILRTFKPKLILMDVRLPGIDGLELTRRIKANPETQGILVVALTASATKDDEDSVRSAGCDGYITKPFEIQKLVWQIREYLDAPKCILVVEDDPVEKNILCGAFERAGFTTMTATDGADAIAKARLSRPALIVSDVFMPGVDGFTLCRAARNDIRLATVPIMLRTAASIEEADESMARTMGASTLVSKNQGSKALLDSVNAALEWKAPVLEPGMDRDIAGIAREFLIEGSQRSLQLCDDLKTGIDIPAAKQLMHRWAGTGGSLGFPEISQAAFAIDSLLELSPSNIDIVEAHFKALPKLFSSALKHSPAPIPVPAEIIEVLSGRNFALAGFEISETSRMQALIERAGATCENPDRAFDITIVKATDDIDVRPYAASAILIVGDRRPGSEEQLERQSHPHDFLNESYTDEEILVRCCQLILRSGIAVTAMPHLSAIAPVTHVRVDGGAVSARVLIADDDPTVTALVSHTLSGFNMEHLATADGADVLRASVEFKPDVIVMDVNMPNVGGFDALTLLKSDDRTKHIPVVLLTARQQEADIMKGFGLGAADYIAKPFNPMELVARIKRLVPAGIP